MARSSQRARFRSYQGIVRLFTELLIDARYGSDPPCEEAFGTCPVAICCESGRPRSVYVAPDPMELLDLLRLHGAQVADLLGVEAAIGPVEGDAAVRARKCGVWGLKASVSRCPRPRVNRSRFGRAQMLDVTRGVVVAR